MYWLFLFGTADARSMGEKRVRTMINRILEMCIHWTKETIKKVLKKIVLYVFSLFIHEFVYIFDWHLIVYVRMHSFI